MMRRMVDVVFFPDRRYSSDVRPFRGEGRPEAIRLIDREAINEATPQAQLNFTLSASIPETIGAHLLSYLDIDILEHLP